LALALDSNCVVADLLIASYEQGLRHGPPGSKLFEI
jgi:hypothetical protein